MLELCIETIKTLLIGINNQNRTLRQVISQGRCTDVHKEVLGWNHPPDLRGANLRSWHGVDLQVSSWTSPFPLDAELRDRLQACGIQRHKGDPATADGPLLLIYRHPADLLEHWHHSKAHPLRVSTVLKGYGQLLQHREQGRLAVDWRLRGLEDASLLAWLDGGAGVPLSISAVPSITPLTRVVLLELFRTAPDLERLYLDLELHGELFGTTADSDLIQRLQQSGDADALMDAWSSAQRTASGWGADDERLSRLESELEHYLLLSREQQRMLKEQNSIGDRALELAAGERDTREST